MITITAVIRVKRGTESLMHEALSRVADYVRDNEPKTIDFFVSVGVNEPNVFTTYERFADRAAMEAHNGSQVVKEVHRIAAPILDGKMILETGNEIASTRDRS